jgi:hypothetical protein
VAGLEAAGAAVVGAEAEVEGGKRADEDAAPMGEKVSDAAAWAVAEAWLG